MLNQEIELLYKAIHDYNIFTEKNLCEGCQSLCRRDVRWHWLLSDEVKNMSSYLDIKKIGDAYFFNDGECPQFCSLSCKIYQDRPLECRLAPISVYAIENQLHWIIDIGCSYYRHYREDKDFWGKIHNFVENLRPFITEKFTADFRNISKSIDTIRPLVKDQDYYVIDVFDK